MYVLIVAAVILLVVVWRGRGKPLLTRGEWRHGAGIIAIGSLFAAAVLAIRGAWEISVALLGVAAVLGLAARKDRGRVARRGPRETLTAEEARAVLGVPASATAEEIRAAHSRLMRVAHPDKGGTSGLAAQLNAARDRLLKGV